MKRIKLELTEDQYWAVHRAIGNDWEDETDELGNKQWYTAEAKKANAFRKRLLDSLIRQYKKQVS